MAAVIVNAVFVYAAIGVCVALVFCAVGYRSYRSTCVIPGLALPWPLVVPRWVVLERRH